MSLLLHFGQSVALHAHITPNAIGAADLCREMSFRLWNERALKLANAIIGLGMAKGDRLAVLAYNRIEWLEIYAAAAHSGIIVVPVNFRLIASEVRYILEDCAATHLIVDGRLAGIVEEIGADLPCKYVIDLDNGDYERLIEKAFATSIGQSIKPSDPWCLMYTSGTTGRPKGAIRSHGAGALLSLTTDVELGFSRDDAGLLVMPMCHANSLYFMGALSYCGARVTVYDRIHFDPEHLLRSLADGIATFTSLVPTHFVRMLGLEHFILDRLNPDKITKFMISSAPARSDTKSAILDYFRNSGLWELYGSTEQGWATMLQPKDQFTKLGSVGRECVGSKPMRLLNDEGLDVQTGEVGEIYSATPYAFDGYWNLPEQTAQAFNGEHLSVGDLARRDEDGYFYLVDRKKNMIISGGENVYPSEVEDVLGAHAAIKDVAVIGLPNHIWGEQVTAIIVLHDDNDLQPNDLIDWCQNRLAGYKRPRRVEIIAEHHMPRTATGKILHRELREQFSASENSQ